MKLDTIKETDVGTIDKEETKSDSKAKEPSMYNVVLINDDYTPVELVVDILKQVFGRRQEQSIGIMMTAHTSGQAIVSTYTKDIAETKVQHAMELAKVEGHPLKLDVEKA